MLIAVSFIQPKEKNQKPPRFSSSGECLKQYGTAMPWNITQQ